VTLPTGSPAFAVPGVTGLKVNLAVCVFPKDLYTWQNRGVVFFPGGCLAVLCGFESRSVGV
jgi:hypothetical protein